MLHTFFSIAQPFLGVLLWLQSSTPPPSPPRLQFQLRHAHALHDGHRVIFSDYETDANSLGSLYEETMFSMKTQTMRTYIPPSYAAIVEARRLSIHAMQSPAFDWDEEEIEGPSTEDRETLLAMAKMSNNAYYKPADAEWYDLGEAWNGSTPFGWQPDEDGFRGHVFVATDNSTVIVSIKGTSAGWIVGGGGPTVVKDKLNDNLLFSCCCARVGPTWSPVCDCFAGGDKCDQACLEKSLVEESLFYSVGTNLYNNITYMYPNARIWLTGHSLGGALASLVGATFGAPTIAFEAPPDRLAARRLHLPSPPLTDHITHVFHTADPIAMGVCNGVTSTCALGGYAMESRCHIGRLLKYDTVSERKWSVGISRHSIKVIVEELLNDDWDEKRAVPSPSTEADCIDCFNWTFGNYNKSLIAS